MGKGPTQVPCNCHHCTGNPYQQAPVLDNKICEESKYASGNACPLVLFDQINIIFTRPCKQISGNTGKQ